MGRLVEKEDQSKPCPIENLDRKTTFTSLHELTPLPRSLITMIGDTWVLPFVLSLPIGVPRKYDHMKLEGEK